MNTTKNQFVCECCGTTTPRHNMEYTITLIGNNDITYKKVCSNCAIENELYNPRYIAETFRSLDPKLQGWDDEQANKKWNELMKNNFLARATNYKMVKTVVGTRDYEGFVEIIDPYYDSCDDEGIKLPIATGNYTCVVWNMDYVYACGDMDRHFSEVDAIGIYLNGKIPAHDDMIKVRETRVDSGLLGIFDVKADLNPSDWLKKKLRSNRDDLDANPIQNIGFIASLSDGGADVFIAVENCEIVAVEIRLCDYIHRGQ